MTAKKKDRKVSAAAQGELRRDVEEEVQIEGHWQVVGPATPLTQRDKDYRYIDELVRLQFELIKLQEWVRIKGLRVVVLFEGRDAAGKGGVIKRITEPLNPRICRAVALATPTERERGQWYFQRYVAQLPARGEIVLFDRSWYNRAGVERVMGFCTEEEYDEFLRSCPVFEEMLIRSGIILIKYWFSVNDEEQEARFSSACAIRSSAGSCAHGPEVARAVGGIFEGQGRHAGPHRHQDVALVHGRRRQQEEGAAELHRPSAAAGALQGPAPGADRAAAAACRHQLQAAEEVVPELDHPAFRLTRPGAQMNDPTWRARDI